MQELLSVAWYTANHCFVTEAKAIGYYIAACFLIAIPIVIRKRNTLEITPQKILWFCFPKNVYFNQAMINDVILFLIGPIASLCIGRILISTPWVSHMVQHCLKSFIPYGVLGADNLYIHTTVLVVGLVILDLIKYVHHRILHSVPWLWELHKVHHSTEVMSIFAESRTHPLQDIFVAIPLSAIFLGTLDGFYQYCFIGASSERTFLYTIFYGALILFAQLQHSHHWISFSPFWSKIFMSPAQHLVHHSCEAHKSIKNLGGFFSIWDKMFGTLYIPVAREEIVYGLGEESKNYVTISDFYLRPLTNIYAMAQKPKNVVNFECPVQESDDDILTA